MPAERILLEPEVVVVKPVVVIVNVGLYGVTPPLAVKVTEPLEPPKHFTAEVSAVKVMGGGDTMLAVCVLGHKEASITVKV